MPGEADPLTTVRQFFEAFNSGSIDEKLSYFAADVVQQEFPNRLVSQTMTRDLAALREGAERGAKILSAERYELLNAIASGDQVACEVQWTGTLAVPFGALPVGAQLRARLAVFLELHDGEIIRQRNYDCYDPW